MENQREYLFNWEVAELFRQKVGLKVEITHRTDFITIARGSRGHLNVLYGPYRDPENPDVRIFISYRRLDGTYSLDLLVQDTDDDAFLNSHAYGTERYHNLRAQWSVETVS